MKTKQKKQFTELSDEELKQVTGGASIDCSRPENIEKLMCKDQGKDLGKDLGKDPGVIVDLNPGRSSDLNLRRAIADVIDHTMLQ